MASTRQPIIYCPLGLGRAGFSQLFLHSYLPSFVVLLLYSGKLPSPVNVVGLKAFGNPFEHVTCCEFLLKIRKNMNRNSKIIKGLDHIIRSNYKLSKSTNKIASEVRKMTNKCSANNYSVTTTCDLTKNWRVRCKLMDFLWGLSPENQFR